MVCSDTLRIKHLPKELSEAQKEDFIRHFGAIKIKVITSKVKAESVVYAKFENQEVAKNVLSRLHQLNVLNCRLSVEYAETDVLQGTLAVKKLSDIKDVPDQRFFKNFINHINAFNDSVGFHQPPPSHLKYNYPKANRSTINNIAHALATVPRFYIQVLHLMNKMNLPPPFAMPEPPVRILQPVVTHKLPKSVPEKRKESSSESEIESDGEPNKNKEIIPQKRKLPQKKTVKRPKFIKQPMVQPSAPTKVFEKPEDIFDKVEVQQPRKIEMRVMPELPQEPEPKKLEAVKKRIKLQKDLAPEAKEDGHVQLADNKGKEQNVKQKLLETPKERQKLTSKENVPIDSVLEVKKPIPTVPIAEVKKETDKILKEEPVTKILLQKASEPAHPKIQKIINVERVSSTTSSPNQGSLPVKKSDQESPQDNQFTSRVIEAVDVPQNLKPHESLQKEEVRTLEVPEEHQEQNKHSKKLVQSVLQVESMETEILPEPASPEDEFPCISLEELSANQITDLSVMPVFKNYSPGDPTNKLYIKNCAKTVAVQDLEYIYNRYREEGSEDKPIEFNIRLMQEGRMKGQAFVTLDSVQMAQKAVTETNGFILKDKPLVVVFGKAGKKK